MKAVRLLEYGGQLMFSDVPAPAIAPDEILVKIRSTAVNHLDLVKASGTARQILPIDLPWIPGHEFSGVVEQIGSAVAAWAPGDAVFGANEVGGAYAALSLFSDFEGFRTFKPGPQRESEVHTMLDQVVAWGRALQTVRTEQST
ncbi:MAG TPA: alcohol dehydrogenase catalytic domain-containing protein [Thermoanaerobaculia bacterium]|jgi:NADPH:quinone reductase-like Zn-dependent oxidoreductase|nr:alcohol dehydrogenase catalytic domain-containing protein [Thermoanaerobaculia bacterium]